MGKKEEVAKFQYSIAERDERVWATYHDTNVCDPYQWMEAGGGETTRFCLDETKRLDDYLVTCPLQTKITEMMELIHEEIAYQCPRRISEDYYLFPNPRSGREPQTEFWLKRATALDGEIVASPREFSASLYKPELAFMETEISEDGKVMAVALNNHGPKNDWLTVHFYSPLGPKFFNKVRDALGRIKYTTLALVPDGSAIFYANYPHISYAEIESDPNVLLSKQTLWFHKLGADQREDIMMIAFPKNPEWFIPACVTYGGRYLLITPNEDCRNNRVYFLDLKKWVEDGQPSRPEFSPVVDNFEAEYHYVTSPGPSILFRTNKNAPNFQLIKIDINRPQTNCWNIILAEDREKMMQACDVAHETYLIVHYTRDLVSILQIRKLRSGALVRVVPFPCVGSVLELRTHPTYPDFYYRFESFLMADGVFRVDLDDGEEVPFLMKKSCSCCCSCKPKEPENYTPTLYLSPTVNLPPKTYTIDQVSYPSTGKGQSDIRMFVCRRKDLKLSGTNPCLLYSCEPADYPSPQRFFSVPNVIFMENMVGVVALAFVQGSNKQGNGQPSNMQTSIADFQAAAQWLIEQKFTCSSKLMAYGTGAGGLVVAASVNQRPDLFSTVILDNAILDLIRYRELDPTAPADYGDISDKASFKSMLGYSPLHNVKLPKDEKIQYPAFLVMGPTEHGVTVNPAHSFKFTAELQYKLCHNRRQTNPLIFRQTNTPAPGKEFYEKVEKDSDILTFILLRLGITKLVNL